MSRDFKIPPERAAGVVEGGAKSFTQTIRAKHSDVGEIPPIELAYFDPESGSYEVARTAAIPLNVQGTRIVTANDAEGFSDAGAVQSEIESSEGGIAYNYEGPDVLLNQAFGAAAWLRSPAWIGGLALPPLIYLALLGFTSYTRWKESDPVARKAKRAFRELSKSLQSLPPPDTDEHYAAALDALRQYLGARLHLSGGALTVADVKKALEARGVDENVVESLGLVFQRSEAGRYAGGGFGDADTPLADSTLQAARELEAAL
ncbi:MAG: protein BatD [bacterium]|nr:protein BatD [bacterium]